MIKQLFYLLSIIGLVACNAEVKTVYPNGNVKEVYTMKKELKDGSYKMYTEAGDLSEEATYKSGKLNGLRKIFFPNGNIEIEENYVEDQLVGSYKVYYESGKLQLESNYVNGVLSGNSKKYFESGGLMEEVTFAENEENGPFKEYFENGQVQWEGNYLNGDNEFGLLQEFDKKGNLIKKMMCDSMGVCQTIWDPERGDIVPDKIKLSKH